LYRLLSSHLAKRFLMHPIYLSYSSSLLCKTALQLDRASIGRRVSFIRYRIGHHGFSICSFVS
ncbi:MAG: hypothetical protein ACK53Y_13645, partial [bacterium]